MAEQIKCERFMEWLPWRDDKLDEIATASGVPSRLQTAEFKHAKPTDAIERCRKWMDPDSDDRPVLTLIGPPGTGKTYAAVCALRLHTSQRHNKHGRFWYLPALASALLDPEDARQTRRQALTTPFLVLDDVGVQYEKPGGLVESFLEELVWTREAEELPTLFTSNLTADQLRARLSDRILDRLAGEWGTVYAVAGPSLRRAT